MGTERSDVPRSWCLKAVSVRVDRAAPLRRFRAVTVGAYFVAIREARLLRNFREDAPVFVRDLKPELANGILAHNLNYRSMRTSNRMAQVR